MVSFVYTAYVLGFKSGKVFRYVQNFQVSTTIDKTKRILMSDLSFALSSTSVRRLLRLQTYHASIETIKISIGTPQMVVDIPIKLAPSPTIVRDLKNMELAYTFSQPKLYPVSNGFTGSSPYEAKSDKK